jgi:ribosomal protein L37AE/L43A
MTMDYDKKLTVAIQKASYYCKKCGHSVFIKNKYKRMICDHCGTMVYKDGKSVYDVNREKFLKRSYLAFLQKKKNNVDIVPK